MSNEQIGKATEKVLKEIAGAINSINYGYVQITIHNSKVVQIEKTEKTRISESSNKREGGEY